MPSCSCVLQRCRAYCLSRCRISPTATPSEAPTIFPSDVAPALSLSELSTSSTGSRQRSFPLAGVTIDPPLQCTTAAVHHRWGIARFKNFVLIMDHMTCRPNSRVNPSRDSRSCCKDQAGLVPVIRPSTRTRGLGPFIPELTACRGPTSRTSPVSKSSAAVL